MNLIIHDVEAISRQRHMYKSEIIEIAAIRAVWADERLEERDRFHAYVQPQDVTSIPIATTNLTGITEQDMKQADRFPQIVAAFRQWLGTEEYFLCSWSLSDRDYFVDDCIRHKLPMDWILNYNDIQRWYSEKLGLRQRVSLPKALESLSLTPEGQQHSALADTVNTLRIAKALLGGGYIVNWERNHCTGVPTSEIVYHDPEQDLQEDDSPFAKLRRLQL